MIFWGDLRRLGGILVCFALLTPVMAGFNRDSLYSVAYGEGPDTARVKAFNKLIQGIKRRYPKEALGYLEDAKDLALQAGDSLSYVKFLQSTGCAHTYLGDYDYAFEVKEEALRQMRTLGNREGEASVIICLGNVHYFQREYGNARDFYKEAMGIYDDLKDTIRLMTCLTNISLTYQLTGEYGLGLEWTQKALKTARAIGDRDYEATNLHGLAIMYDYNGEEEKALEAFREACDLYLENGGERNAMTCLNSMGEILGRQGKSAEAIKVIREALALHEKTGTGKLHYSLNSLGDHYTEIGKLDSAKYYLDRALVVARNAGTGEGLSRVYLNLGTLHKKLGNFALARDYYLKSMEKENLEQNPKGASTLYKNMSLIYAHLGNFKEAYLYRLKYFELWVEMNDKERREHYELLNTKYETEKKEQAIRDLEQTSALAENELKLQEANLSRVRRGRLLLGGGLVFIIFIALGLVRTNHLRGQANRRQESARKQAESAREKAEKSEQLMEQFLVNMSHEIRTPINAVMGNAFLLSDATLDEEQQQRVDTIRYATENLLVLLNDILDLSRLESGHLPLEKIPFKLTRVIGGAMATLQIKAAEKNIRLSSQLDCTPDLSLVGDPFRLNQILINLISNAIKFTHEGGVTVVATCSQGSSPDKMKVLFSVRDTGIGIPADKQEEIFLTFRQAGADISRKYGGTGLGLAITKRLVDLQEGWIGVESKVGQGTEFRFEIEFGIVPGEATVEAAHEAHYPTDFHGAKILVVDDNEANRNIAADLLTAHFTGLEIVQADSGEAALQICKNRLFHLILMDLHMSGISGTETAARLRNEGLISDKTQIVALSAGVTEFGKDSMLDTGMTHFFEKPIRPEEFIPGVGNILSGLVPEKKKVDVSPVQGDFDLSGLRDLAGKDIRKVREYVTIFLESNNHHLHQLQNPANEDEKANRVSLHTLRSNALYLGAGKMVEIIRQMDRKNPSAAQIAELTRVVRKVEALLRKEMDTWT